MAFPHDGRKMKKGETLNPNGRPKLPDLRELSALILGEEKDGVSAAEAILKKLRQMAANGNLKAAEMLLDRGYGKPRQSIDSNVTISQFPSPIIEIPKDEPNETEPKTGAGMEAP